MYILFISRTDRLTQPKGNRQTMKTYHGTFPVEPGVGIFMPNNTIRRHSIRAKDHPNTPILYLLSSGDKGERRHFKQNEHRRGHDPENQSGFHLFTPETAKPGDLLVVEWVTKTCAGTRLATNAELEAIRQEQQENQSAMGAW